MNSSRQQMTPLASRRTMALRMVSGLKSERARSICLSDHRSR